MKIEVTQADIDAGERLNCIACPVARAVIRVLGRDIGDIMVDGGRVLLDRELNWATHSMLLPDSARAFIRAFDNGLEVSPFTFDLEP